MKGNFIGLITILLLAFLFCSYSTSARLLLQQEVANEFKGKQIVQAVVNEDFSKLMGSDSEECHAKDEECLKRRMAAEAHLDYIYTQDHKP